VQQDAVVVDGDPQVYRLRAVVRHTGSGLNSGHYIADVLVRDSWFRFDDDETVERIQQSTRSSRRASGLAPDGPCAYILFYERQVLASRTDT
jgi:ubiquitin C-terminal hydrolase